MSECELRGVTLVLLVAVGAVSLMGLVAIASLRWWLGCRDYLRGDDIEWPADFTRSGTGRE